MLALIASPIARYLAGAAVVVGMLGYVYNEGKRQGASSVRAEIAAQQERKVRDAVKADEDAMRCAADPTCRLQSDGFRRD